MENHPYKKTDGFNKQLNMSKAEIESQGFKDGGIWTNSTEVIVCGTFPPKKEYLDRKGYMHYSSPLNKFWRHLDAIYNTSFDINSAIAQNEEMRINNALKKILFALERKIGFVDIFLDISRRDPDSSSDDDIIEPFVTIFDNEIFTQILESNVSDIVFVYKRSYDEFINGLNKKFPDYELTTIREYGKNDITLKVEKAILGNKNLRLSYSPIHGRVKDIQRRPALKKALEGDHR